MKTDKEFFQEIEQLVLESGSKKLSPMKNEQEFPKTKSRKQFFKNKNRKDINEAWKEIENLFENLEISGKNSPSKELIINEEIKVNEIKEILLTPQPKITNSHNLETTKLKDSLQMEDENKKNDFGTNRKLTFNLD